MSRKSEELNQATISVMRVAILSSAVLELFVTIAIAAIAIYLGFSLMGIMNGPNYGKGYDFGTALFLLTITPYFFFYIRKFVSAYHDRNRALAAADLLMPLLTRTPETPPTDMDETFDQITISNLSFAYPDSPVKVLHNIPSTSPKRTGTDEGISGSGNRPAQNMCRQPCSTRSTVSVNDRITHGPATGSKRTRLHESVSLHLRRHTTIQPLPEKRYKEG